MSELQINPLLETPTLALRDVSCRGACRRHSDEECAAATYLVFPYRGVYLRHVGDDQAVADANHVLFFNAGEGYRVSHPIDGGDHSVSLALSAEILAELVPISLLRDGGELAFRRQSQRIDARAQALVAVLRHALRGGVADPLEAESLLLTLVSRSLGPRTSHAPGATRARRRLVDRVKLLLASDLSRRWTLAEIAARIGGSPVHLTQAFQQVERLPLYRYQLQLRLARALDRVPHEDDLAALALDLGFSSHSHFAAAFKLAYGRSPSAFKRSTRR